MVFIDYRLFCRSSERRIKAMQKMMKMLSFLDGNEEDALNDVCRKTWRPESLSKERRPRLLQGKTHSLWQDSQINASVPCVIIHGKYYTLKCLYCGLWKESTTTDWQACKHKKHIKFLTICILFVPYLLNESQTIRSMIHFSKALLWFI